ncbi:hypothetical protein HK096_001559 [Nowakowskiella sp. JEL0078]|nr:hypothetical protein HK096_001559 [Nowakowskiella sp. JEL0078]
MSQLLGNSYLLRKNFISSHLYLPVFIRFKTNVPKQYNREKASDLTREARPENEQPYRPNSQEEKGEISRETFVRSNQYEGRSFSRESISHSNERGNRREEYVRSSPREERNEKNNEPYPRSNHQVERSFNRESNGYSYQRDRITDSRKFYGQSNSHEEIKDNHYIRSNPRQGREENNREFNTLSNTREVRGEPYNQSRIYVERDSTKAIDKDFQRQSRLRSNDQRGTRQFENNYNSKVYKGEVEVLSGKKRNESSSFERRTVSNGVSLDHEQQHQNNDNSADGNNSNSRNETEHMNPEMQKLWEKAKSIAQEELEKEKLANQREKRMNNIKKKHEKKRLKREARKERLALKAMTPKEGKNKTKSMKKAESMVMSFLKSKETMAMAEIIGISPDIYEKSLNSFLETFKNGLSHHITHAEIIIKLNNNETPKDIIFSALVKHTHDFFPSEELHLLSNILESADLRSPLLLYPETRAMPRNIFIHVGPTNSGKTHAALVQLEKANSGIYLGPLRLLAHEIYDRMNKNGIPCNLITGEERRESDGVNMIAATVEMAPLSMDFDVAVIDEIQMIGDDQRGWAWTQALLGLKAKEIHLCGEETAVKLVERLLMRSKDQISITKYERLKPLHVSSNVLQRLKNVQKGDCVVSFSRNEIFALKQAIETTTVHRCAVIYGALPPEIRSEQAKLFNDPNSGYDILVASDAIGMGLNLNIQRIIFYSMEKFNGNKLAPISLPQVKQIAGRAGRFSSEYENGVATTVVEADVRRLRHCMKERSVDLRYAGILPTVEQLEEFAKNLPDRPLHVLLILFEYATRVEGNYTLCNLKEQKRIAMDLQHIPNLSLRDLYTFCQAPIPNVPAIYKSGNVKSLKEEMTELISEMASAVAERREYSIDKFVKFPEETPTNNTALKTWEEMHKRIILYIKLNYRFPHTFKDTQEAIYYKNNSEAMINKGLENMRFELSKRKQKKLDGLSEITHKLVDVTADKELNLAEPDDFTGIDPTKIETKAKTKETKPTNIKNSNVSKINWTKIDYEKLDEILKSKGFDKSYSEYLLSGDEELVQKYLEAQKNAISSGLVGDVQILEDTSNLGTPKIQAIPTKQSIDIPADFGEDNSPSSSKMETDTKTQNSFVPEPESLINKPMKHENAADSKSVGEYESNVSITNEIILESKIFEKEITPKKITVPELAEEINLIESKNIGNDVKQSEDIAATLITKAYEDIILEEPVQTSVTEPLVKSFKGETRTEVEPVVESVENDNKSFMKSENEDTAEDNVDIELNDEKIKKVTDPEIEAQKREETYKETY